MRKQQFNTALLKQSYVALDHPIKQAIEGEELEPGSDVALMECAREATRRKRVIWGVDRLVWSQRARRWGVGGGGGWGGGEVLHRSADEQRVRGDDDNVSARERPTLESRVRMASWLEAELRRE